MLSILTYLAMTLLLLMTLLSWWTRATQRLSSLPQLSAPSSGSSDLDFSFLSDFSGLEDLDLVGFSACLTGGHRAVCSSCSTSGVTPLSSMYDT